MSRTRQAIALIGAAMVISDNAQYVFRSKEWTDTKLALKGGKTGSNNQTANAIEQIAGAN